MAERMEQARLDAILAQHAEWVASGGERGTRADLTSANLRSADLTSANLYGANVNGVLGRRLMSVGPVGSRNGLLIYDADADMVYAGCWRSSLADLLERVEAVYPEGSQHRAGYLLAIEWLIRALAL